MPLRPWPSKLRNVRHSVRNNFRKYSRRNRTLRCSLIVRGVLTEKRRWNFNSSSNPRCKNTFPSSRPKCRKRPIGSPLSGQRREPSSRSKKRRPDSCTKSSNCSRKSSKQLNKRHKTRLRRKLIHRRSSSRCSYSNMPRIKKNSERSSTNRVVSVSRQSQHLSKKEKLRERRSKRL